MRTTTYMRKSFSVEAVQVTEENMKEVAQWCDGDKRKTKKSETPYIKVVSTNPITVRQTMAFAGDWVLKDERGFKVYTDKAFRNSFVCTEDSPEEVASLV